METTFGATWGEETFEIPQGEMNCSASALSSEWEPDSVSEEPMPAEELKTHECLQPGPVPRAVAHKPTCVDRVLPPHMAACKLGLDGTMDLLSGLLGAGDEDPDLSALSAALKTKLGVFDLKGLQSTMSPAVERLTKDVKNCRGIRSLPMHTCASPFHPHVRTVPVCTVGDATEAEMKRYGQAALASLATTHPSSPSGGTGDPGSPGRGTKPIAMANLQIELPEFHPESLPE